MEWNENGRLSIFPSSIVVEVEERWMGVGGFGLVVLILFSNIPQSL
jgi:hypothetical protein